MKFITAVGLIGLTLFAAGCAEERIPADEADAWEVPVDSGVAPTTDAATTANPEANAPAPEALPPGVVAVVKGSAFQIDGTTETKASTSDQFTVAHYFIASAPIELKTSATVMESDLEGKTSNGSVPLITMQLVSTSGKYRSFTQEARPIDGKQVLRDSYDIGPGSYKISMSYHKDTIGKMRPPITLNSVTFRNEPASDIPPAAPAP